MRRHTAVDAPQKHIIRVIVAIAVCALAGCSSTSLARLTGQSGTHKLTAAAREVRSQANTPADLPRELDKHPSPPTTVEPGDVVLVHPTEIDSPIRLPSDQPILPDGTITLGRYGRIVVAGLTLGEIEAAVHSQIEARTQEKVAVGARLVSRQSKVYYVLGEVNAPGAFQFNGRETVLDAIMAAGGLNDRASRQYITLARPTAPDSCRIVLPICYNEIVQLGDTSTNYQIAAGDRIYVPSKTMQEDFCRNKPACPPCGRPQRSCWAADCGQLPAEPLLAIPEQAPMTRGR
jgi:protein involved in polysaccharide export with SLBB domain